MMLRTSARVIDLDLAFINDNPPVRIVELACLRGVDQLDFDFYSFPGPPIWEIKVEDFIQGALPVSVTITSGDRVLFGTAVPTGTDYDYGKHWETTLMVIGSLRELDSVRRQLASLKGRAFRRFWWDRPIPVALSVRDRIWGEQLGLPVQNQTTDSLRDQIMAQLEEDKGRVRFPWTFE